MVAGLCNLIHHPFIIDNNRIGFNIVHLILSAKGLRNSLNDTFDERRHLLPNRRRQSANGSRHSHLRRNCRSHKAAFNFSNRNNDRLQRINHPARYMLKRRNDLRRDGNRIHRFMRTSGMPAFAANRNLKAVRRSKRNALRDADRTCRQSGEHMKSRDGINLRIMEHSVLHHRFGAS
ncbi:hypothetical protein D3C80_1342550 [compost metagenome]